MRLQLRRPAGLWLPLSMAAALALLTALWFAADLVVDGAQEAREDVLENALRGLVWLAPAAIWMAWRPPRSRAHAILVTTGFLAVASALNLLFIYRSLAEDLGLPMQVSVALVGSMSVILVLLQVVIGMLPAVLLQALMYDAAPERRRRSSPGLAAAGVAGGR